MRRAPIFWIIFLDEIGMNIGFPVLTFLCFDKQSSLFALTATHAVRSYWYGLLNSLPFIIAIFTVPILTWLSDYYGRKKILLFGSLSILAFSIFATLGILYGTIALVVIGRIINGICARIQPTALAVIGDISNEKNKIINMGYLQFYISIGAFLGPIIGGYFAKRFFFQQLNFSLPFIIAAGFGLLTLLFIAFGFKETLTKPAARKVSFSDVLQLFKNPKILKISLLLLLTQISWRIYYQFIPPVLKIHFHYTPQTIGIFVALIAAWLALASSIGLKILDKLFAAKYILYLAITAEFFGFLLANLANHLPANLFSQTLTWFAAAPIAIGDVIIYSLITTFYSDTASEHDQGKVMGINYIIVTIVWSSTGIIGGLLAAVNINLPIIVAPLGLLGAILWNLPKKISY
ncbi:MAG: MFS transporter [Gammaproteobacteria bacterium]|jgi:MFS family permease